MFERLFKTRTTSSTGQALYAEAVARARNPALYTDHQVPDTREGRFEMYSLHVALLVERLRNTGEAGAEASQDLFDAYVRGLDDAFRELGVGDLALAKRMKALGEAFYGRMAAYDRSVEALPDLTPLTTLLGRTIWDSPEHPARDGLARHLVAERAGLAGTETVVLLAGRWPAAVIQVS